MKPRSKRFMPASQPFTRLCQLAGRSRSSGRADLHVHTTCSDGNYTPAEIVDLARRTGLSALAITDHDTLEGIAPARSAARGLGLDIVPGVEITAEHLGRELHLLAYYVDPEDGALLAALRDLRQHRKDRFWDMAERLRHCGVTLDEEELRAEAAVGVVGRRNLATLLVKARRAGSVREAFQRWLGDGGRVTLPNVRLPIADAIRLTRDAGGVASWAHPPANATRETLVGLCKLGLQAVEASYPTFRTRWSKQLRDWAAELGLAVTGGSDCHGPGRDLGVCSVTAEELAELRSLATA
ncbi:MAG: PHP domain-containing protein [Planctomycetia bacterium]|nr:PHP domain-containing protein [Planctomycetia bacterium]